MMVVNGKNITQLIIQEKKIVYFYIGDKLIWQSVQSCFGAGYWNGDKPWKGDEAWKG